MSLNHMLDTVEKKWMNLGVENLVVYGSTTIPDVKTSKVELADGSVSTPSLTFQNQLNTGIYRVGASEIAVSCNGTQILDVNQGSVKINASNSFPNYPLLARLNVGQGQDVGNKIVALYGSGERIVFTDQNLGTSQPLNISFGTGLGGEIKVNGKKGIQLYDNSAGPFTSVITGTQLVIPNNATDGFIYIPEGVNPPIGVPTFFVGSVATFIDSINLRLWAYCNGAWKSVLLS